MATLTLETTMTRNLDEMTENKIKFAQFESGNKNENNASGAKVLSFGQFPMENKIDAATMEITTDNPTEAVKVFWSHHVEGKNGKSNNFWKDCREKRPRLTTNNIREALLFTC
ncbi:hypothetical protein HELRODRAFT_175193 [Helobdella robusta]|uniref:Uncharacterized protein n=1 Tax=Helobdella robusta TaxID=6412 RepID=T1F8Z5_HELRO|nr:hypothetical protein HELRODRAFT_175193 [Helobdella robusta]ESO01164.1 hypothetical protein HELRODRAFT_175193 [Helobdella robusta]